MKRIIGFLTILFISLQIIIAQVSEKRLALVIGNAAYQYSGELRNPVNDANLMANTLQDLGFTVIKRTDATKEQMDNAILNFWRKLGNCDVALFYYAGHGVQLNGINYLLPVDAQLEDRLSVEIEAVDVNKIVNKFEYYPENINIVILDACRNNPFRSWVRGGMRGFTAIPAPSGTIIAYATSAGATASDGTGSNGLYTEKLTQQIKIEQRIEDVFINTRVAVQQASGGNQSPQEWSQLTGKFYFTQTAFEAPGKPVVGTVEKVMTYGSIELTTDISGELYLDGKRLANISSNTKVPINKVTTGSHRLQIVGNENWTENITVNKDQTTRITARSNKPYNTYKLARSGAFTDTRDNEDYKWVKIGSQTWMAENLNYKTAYGSWCYDNKESNCNTYGRLYIWETARRVCPDGWHLPTDEEWKKLERHLGMSQAEADEGSLRGTDEGGKLKETGLRLWKSPNRGSNNETGFSALPGGFRSTNSYYYSKGSTANFWSSAEGNSNTAWVRELSCYNSGVDRYHDDKVVGFSVRCVRDK
ncbi:MAG: caspase family protein [Bacteroidales bacterium]|nr:caspase family protein [Bacteroidales bacterium]